MPIKSFFVPKMALQGEEIPLHAIWKDLNCHSIRMNLSGSLQLKEVFNARKTKISEDKRVLLVQELEEDGYLGIVLKARRLNEVRHYAQLSLTFLDRSGRMVEKRDAEVHLFRPNIVVVDDLGPDLIIVDIEKARVRNRVKLKNSGEGTALVTFKTRGESEICLKVPKSIEEFRERFQADAKENMKKVQNRFPEYSKIVKEYVGFLKATATEVNQFKKAEKVLKQITSGFEANEDFGWAFIEALGAAFMKNVHLVTIFENLLGYLSSIHSKKVLIYDPLQVIQVSKKPKTLAIDIHTTDMLTGEYPEIKLKKVKVVSNQSGEIQVHRLFDWR